MIKKKLLAKMLFFAVFLLVLNGAVYAQWREPQNVNMLEAAVWDRNSDGSTTINVCWENPSGYGTGMQWVKDSVEKTWQAEANVDFRGWEKCVSFSKGIRILINDTAAAPHTKGLGKQLDGKSPGMVLNFTFKKWKQENGDPACGLSTESCVKLVAIHEFGHALGLAHEQNRSDNPDSSCGKEHQGTDGGYYVTPYDKNSVMNYCNKRWINNGVLSELDKEGIRTIYGERRKNPRYQNTQSVVSVTDQLTLGQLSETESVEQLWENVYVEIDGKGQLLHVDKSNLTHTQKWDFSQTGPKQYKVWSYTIQNEFTNGRYTKQTVRLGFGEGNLSVTKGSNQTFSVNINSWNSAGYFNVILAPTLNLPTTRITLKEIEQDYNSNLIDSTITKARIFLQTEPNNAKVNAMLGFSLLTKKKIDTAVVHLERAVVNGDTLTIPLKTIRIRGFLNILLLNDGVIVIGKDKLAIGEPGKSFVIGLSSLTAVRLENYQNQCPYATLEGQFIEFKENSNKTKQEAKSFNLFPLSTTIQTTMQNNESVNVIACRDEGIFPTAVVKLINRLRL